MPTRDQIDAWAATLDETQEMRARIQQTIADPPEPRVDLSGATSRKPHPPLPGGIKLALIGPHSLYAEPDALAHPGVFMDKWSGYVAQKACTIPPRPMYDVQHAFLTHRLQYIADNKVSEFEADLYAVRNTLRNVTHYDRPSRAELVADRWMRGQRAQDELRARQADIPWGFMLNREQAEIIWPDALTEDRWHSIRQWKIDNPGENIPPGKYPAGLIRHYIGKG